MSFIGVAKTLRLSWREHKAVQIATLVVLTATFTVVVSVVSLTINFGNILQSWGESVQVTAYIRDGVNERDVAAVGEAIKAMDEFKEIKFVTKEQAKTRFAEQMTGFASGLVNDAGLENPFPASFQISFAEKREVANLSELARKIQELPAVEDVSYGQDWIQNYESLVNTFKWGSWGLTVILVFGSLLVVSNSIRASIDRRRDEIEILKLVGATSSMIRRPFIFEGAFMGAAATALSLVFSYVFYFWQLHIVGQNLAFANVASQFQFLSGPAFSAILAAGVGLGALGSYGSVFRISSSTLSEKGW